MDDDPTCANLREIHPQYFEAGHLCTSLFHNDAGELAEMLPEVALAKSDTKTANFKFHFWLSPNHKLEYIIFFHQILQQRILCIGETTIATQENPWIQQIAGSKAVNPEFMDILEHQLYSDSKNASTGVQDWLEPILSSRGGASGSAQPQQQQQSTSQSAHGTHQMTSLQQQQEAAGTSAGHHSMAMSNQNQYQNQQQYAAPTYPPPNYHHTMNTTPAGNVDNSCPMPLNPTARYPPQYYQQ